MSSNTPAFIYLMLLTAFIVMGCNGNENDHHTNEMPEESVHEETNAEIQDDAGNSVLDGSAAEHFDSMLEEYLDLTDALVSSDAEAAASYSEHFYDAVQSFQQTDIDASLRADVGILNMTLLEMSDIITGSKDIEDQRGAYEKLSETMIAMVKRLGHQRDALYHQRCPMVNGGDGDWLSTEEEIRNPYHGDRMMNCGSVVQRL